jgi:hypothetical protein
MSLSNSELDQLILARTLVSIQREAIDSNKVRGIPLAYSQELLLLQYVFDFHLDGLLLIRRADIASLKTGDTDRFQTSLMNDANLLDRVPFTGDWAIESFRVFLSVLTPKQFAIVEDELSDPPEFYIGRVISTDRKTIEIHEFSGVAKWAENVTEIDASKITCVQVGTNYIKFYEDYFRKT